MLKVLIACEESQTECLAFRKMNCEAYSADLQECSGGHPEWHFTGDCRNLFHPGTYTTQAGTRVDVDKWDLIIAHPPCTYLSRVCPYNTPERIEKGIEAAAFFFEMLNAPADYVCVENPVPKKRFKLPKSDFACNPYDYGSPWRKKTLYWLRNLPPLMYGCSCPPGKSWVRCTRGSKKRSKSFPVIAQAMAEQWVPYILDDLSRHK